MDSVRRQTLDRELAHAMRTGPFSALLHLAIEASALTLDELQYRLTAHGARVSVSTLSYWRRGRSRPERPESLRAVHLLEKILDLPEYALTAQLGPQRPRGRWLTHPAGGLDLSAAYGGGPEFDALLNDVETPVHNGLTRLSVHDLYSVGPTREEVGLTTRAVLRAHANRISRFTVTYRQEDPAARAPRLRAVRGCRVGRVRADATAGFLVAELVLDRVLDRGDTAVVEYEASDMAFGEVDYYYRVFPAPVGEYVLQVQFDPAAVPARCWRYERSVVRAPDQRVREVWVGGTQLAHVVALDVSPSVLGMRWEWD
ncbi:hypothetical protein AB0K51_14035 [Kitasatospora sp. NPDC049285]|uniref:hypothetical protein n=1 Tax=Kitasatospora sp. NPDC049285 TaxID=3157096 RepID=UPI00341DBF90